MHKLFQPGTSIRETTFPSQNKMSSGSASDDIRSSGNGRGRYRLLNIRIRIRTVYNQYKSRHRRIEAGLTSARDMCLSGQYHI